jgi:hypothetical protein
LGLSVSSEDEEGEGEEQPSQRIEEKSNYELIREQKIREEFFRQLSLDEAKMSAAVGTSVRPGRERKEKGGPRQPTSRSDRIKKLRYD